MDSDRFHRLVKGLGTGTDRRRVLGMLAGSVAAVLGGRQATRAQGNSDCAASCKEDFGPGRKRGQCISACAKNNPCTPGTPGSCPNGETCCEIREEVFACRLLPEGSVCLI
jgi:hypothetical protein